MITPSDSYNTYDLGKYYVILPSVTNWNLQEFINSFGAIKVPQGFSYNSGDNTEWETVDSLKNLIKENLYPDFE